MEAKTNHGRTDQQAAGVLCTLGDSGAPAAFFACAPDGIAGLRPEVRASLEAACVRYCRETGEAPVVTSGWRSLKSCAQLMAGFDRGQLEGMYCRHGYASYVRDLLAARERLGRRLTGEEAYEILCRREEGYISWHLQGGAVDIQAPVSRPGLFRKCLEDVNFTVFDEQELGVACYHATYRGLEPQIIRK